MNDVIDDNGVRDFRAKREEMRVLRDHAIDRKREDIRSFCTDFDISVDDLVEPLLRKRRGRKAKQDPKD